MILITNYGQLYGQNTVIDRDWVLAGAGMTVFWPGPGFGCSRNLYITAAGNFEL